MDFRMSHAAALLCIVIAAPAAGQSQSGGSGNPLDTSGQGPIQGELPTNQLASPGGGTVLPNTPGDVTRATDARTSALAEIHAVSEGRKVEAMKMAERVKAGAQVPAELVPQLRSALSRDLELWRTGYNVGGKEYKAAQQRWLRDPASLTPAEWVLWRAAWFDERDRWLATKGGLAAR